MTFSIIKLPNNYLTIIDSDDIVIFDNCSSWLSSSGYVMVDGKPLHRHIIKCTDKFIIDHINGYTFDNRKSNLRVCNASENSSNKRISSNNTSGYKGVKWEKSLRKYVAYLTKDNVLYRLGSFHSALEAAKVYDEAALLYHGEFARPNFFKVNEIIDIDLINYINYFNLNNVCVVPTSLYRQNSKKLRADNSIGHKGIVYDKKKQLFRARIFLNGKEIHLGRFKQLEDAIKARKEGELQFFTKLYAKDVTEEVLNDLASYVDKRDKGVIGDGCG